MLKNYIKERKVLIIKLLQFLLAGLPSFLLAIPLNYYLVSILKIDKPIAYFIVLIFQITINFFLVKRFIFKGNEHDNIISQFIKFFIGISFFRFLDWSFYTIVVSVTDINFLFVQIFNVVLFSIMKFLYSKRVLEN